MLAIREAIPSDNDSLQQIMAQCPQGTSLIITPINTPDFFARVKAYHQHKVFVAEDGDAIMGSAACAIREVLVNGTLQRVGYEFQYFTAPAYRRRAVGSQLHQQIEQYLIEQGAVASSLFIVPGNIPSMRMFERQGFQLHRTLVSPVVLVYQSMPIHIAGTIRNATLNDLEAVAQLINQTWADANFYAPATAESIQHFIERTPGYSLDQLVILEEQGRIVGCVGIWDWSKIMQLTINALSLPLQMMGWFLDAARLFRPMPRMPQPGETFKQWGLTPLGFTQPAHMATLLREVNNRAVQVGIEQIIVAIAEPQHPLLQCTRGFIAARTEMQLYLKKLQPQVQLDQRQVYADVIDF